MAKRRKVGNLLALGVLTTLVQRQAHPYEMASLLRAWSKDEDLQIKWGSFYTVVRNLEKHGFIAEVESTRQGGRPERTVYRITDAGRAELEDWTRELISVPEREHPRFEAGLSVLGGLPPDEAVVLLGQRLTGLEERIADQREALRRNGDEVPRLFLVEAEYALAMREAEAAWVRSLLDELTTGSFPGLAQWGAFHETGDMPPELTDLTRRGRTTD
ncbi:PadR family transcriptional regulator [Streptosporangium sp. NPDC051023]|uniref:PadR family transcriptional regulator n=1 Tax=Streptosporangium sp. NPDC051023 TaxID=3155410 RepID=UPI00344DE895